MESIGALSWRLLKEANKARKEWKTKELEKKASGAMGIATARQSLSSVNGGGSRSIDVRGEKVPDRVSRGDGK